MAAEDKAGRFPPVLLERYLAGDLPEGRRREIEAACAADPALRDELDRLREGNRAFLAADPPELFAHRLAVRLALEQPAPAPSSRRWAFILAPSAAAALTLVLVLVVHDGARTPMAPGTAQTATAPSAAPDALVEQRPAPTPVSAADGARADAPAEAKARATVTKPPARRERPSLASRAAESPRPVKQARDVDDRAAAGPAVLDLAEPAAPAPPPPSPAATAAAPVELAPPPAELPAADVGRSAAGGSAKAKSKPRGAAAAAPAKGSDAERAGGAGRVGRAEVIAALRSVQPHIAACLRQARDAGELEGGRYAPVASWIIEPSGAVRSAVITEPASWRQLELGRCLGAALRRMRFVAGEAAIPVRNVPLGPLVIE